MADIESTRMEKARRAARIARIIDRLHQVDDGTLEAIDRVAADAISSVGSARPQQVNRRRFLGAAAAGGAVIVATGGLAIWQLKLNEDYTNDLESEVAALENVITLYEEMDAAGLDVQVEQGLSTVGRLVEGMQGMAEGLLSAIGSAREALLDFQSRFSALRTSFQWLQGELYTLSQRLLGLENEVNQVLELSGSIGETMEGFLLEVTDQLPSRASERLRGGLERVGEVVTAVPGLIQGLYARIMEPMDDWFSNSTTEGLNGWIVNPILTTVLDPAQALIASVHSLTESWQEELGESVQQSLSRRREIREEISRLR